MTDRLFSVMIKPAGSACSMACRYCYYLGKDKLLGTQDLTVMKPSVLERTIRTALEASDSVSFTWHGGEPTLAGLDFFRSAVKLQKKYRREGQSVWNSLQTNGLALDAKWCEFLYREHFDVGLSVDGDREDHDLYRLDREGRGTYDRVKDACQRLMDAGIRPDLLCTVTRDREEKGKLIYRSLSELKTGWVQFIPIVIRKGNDILPPSVTPEGYGRFLTDVFFEWARRDVGKCDVQLIAETARILSGGKPSLCWMSGRCGEVPVVEKDGRVYLCDHFVDGEHVLADLRDMPLERIYALPERKAFGDMKETELPAACAACQYRTFCGGGCPKDRLADGTGRTSYYLCEGLRAYFKATLPVLQKIMRMSSSGMRPETIMNRLFPDGGA